jgi:hypothetical protein
MAVPYANYLQNNKYSKWYSNIIESALSRGWTKSNVDFYVESHHIIPKSIDSFYEKDKSNIVCLTAREHYICHLLLVKCVHTIYKNKMLFALHKIVNGNPKKYVGSSHLYAQIKEQISLACSERNKIFWKNMTSEERSKMRSGKNNSMYGKNHTDEVKIQQSKRMKGKFSGEKHPLWGIGHTEESKKKMSANAAKKNLGKRWYHDPETKKQKYFFENQQPEGWVLGRGR